MIHLEKKALIVSSWAPPAISGSAQFLRHILSKFDASSYCFFTSRRNITGEKSEDKRTLAAKYFFYEDAKIFKTKLFPFTYDARTSIWTKIFQKIRRWVLQILRALSMTRAGLRIIQDEKIEILVGTSDIGTSAILTFVLSKLSRKPYVLLMFDLYRENIFPFPWSYVARIAEPILFKFAKAVVTVTEDARDLYAREYGLKERYHVLPLCLDETTYPQSKTHEKVGGTHKIVYTGSIYWAQQKSIENMIRAVDSIHDKNVRFEVYTQNVHGVVHTVIQKVAASTYSKIAAALPDEVLSILNHSDILFLPLSWHTKSPRVISTVVPFKLMEYMLSGKPILIHAPPETYVSRYARKEGFAHVVDEENVDALTTGIKKILNDTAYAKKLVLRAQETFYKYHRASTSSNILAKILENAAEK